MTPGKSKELILKTFIHLLSCVLSGSLVTEEEAEGSGQKKG